MRVRRFEARVAAGPRGSAVIAIPFDPDQAWGARAEHRVGGTINGRQVRGTITPGGRGWTMQAHGHSARLDRMAAPSSRPGGTR